MRFHDLPNREQKGERHVKRRDDETVVVVSFEYNSNHNETKTNKQTNPRTNTNQLLDLHTNLLTILTAMVATNGDNNEQWRRVGVRMPRKRYTGVLWWCVRGVVVVLSARIVVVVRVFEQIFFPSNTRYQR